MPLGPASGQNEYAGEMPWDTLGRVLFGEGTGSILGGVPGVGAVGRWFGEATAVGLGSVESGIASSLGALPSLSHLFDNAGLGEAGGSGIKPFDPKYDPTQSGGAKSALQLFVDLRNENGSGNMARQFMVVGQWMQKYDPGAFEEWQAALAKAQQETFGAKGAEYISNFLAQWGTAYADLTPEGVQDAYLDVAPELYFGGSGSLGQGIARDLGYMFNLQRMAERGAARVSGNVEGFGHTAPPAGEPDRGSRVNAIMWYGANDPDKLTEIEKATYRGVTELGWTDKHAYNFLIAHGQGYSHDPLTQIVLSFGLDPLGVAAVGAGMAASVGAKTALYANTVASGNRLGALSQAGARAIGTTVAAVRADPVLGPVSKIARTLVDPFSALPGPQGQAMVDIFASAGTEGTTKGFGIGAVTNAARRSDGWEARAAFDNAWAISSVNMARKWVVAGIVDDLAHTVGTSARRTIDEDLIQHVGQSAAKDSVTRLAAFAMKNREFWLSDIGQRALAERIAKVVNRPVDDVNAALAGMSRDEQAVWHQASYSHAWSQFKNVVAGILPDEWGKLQKKLPDMVILNPQELDLLSAQELRAALEATKSTKAQARLWNEAASRFEKIDAIGRVSTGGKNQIKRYQNALDTLIEQGHLHTAATPQEIVGMPQAFQDQFLAAWTDSNGGWMWRIGFKPLAEQATGLVYDKAGKLAAWYTPSVDNVAQAAEVLTRRSQPLTDILGRAAKATAPGRAALIAKDSLDVAVQTALDRISGDRIMTSMEQSFRRSMRDAGFSDKVARNTFRLAREAAQDHGFTLAGMSPEEFWRASQSELSTMVDARVAKREVFTMLAKAAGGDMRTLGTSSWMTQRIRSGLIARGLDPNNYMGAVTVKLYNLLRYALNPTFFLQAEFDAPWFNMYKGIVPLGGRSPKPGSDIWEMEQITNAMGHTGLSRDLQMDFTERTATIGWQEAVRDGLQSMPGVKGGFSRFTQWTGRMILNNELAYMNTRIGDAVFDALDHVRSVVDDKIANAVSEAERSAWQSVRFDQTPMMSWLHDDFVARIGRVPTREELGRDYLAQMIDDSLLEVRTKEGLLDYTRVNSKGEYMKPTSIGDIRPLDLDYGAQALQLPNIYNADTLRDALDAGTVMIGDVKDIMIREGFHRDAIKRFTAAIKFNWRSYFDGLAHDLAMSRYEMQGIEDMITRQARAAGMTNVDYLTQVMPLTTEKAMAKQYASTGRVVTKAEMATLQARGQELLNVPPASKPVDLAANIDAVADDLYQRTALVEWGGATYSPRTGTFIEEANPWLYHGTSASNEAGIAGGSLSGTFTTDPADKAIPRGQGMIQYRVRQFRAKTSPDKFPEWQRARGVKPEDMQISRDAGQSWEDVVAGSNVADGPWVSGIGKTTSISIKEAQDPAKFRAALDEFVAENYDELQKPGMYVGTFRDEKLGKVEFDVARATFTRADTEAVQAAAGRKGGAYNFATGNGLFAPTLEPMAQVSEELKFTLDTFRAIEKGEAGIDDLTKLVTGHLQPSMKARLLEHFQEALPLNIQAAYDAGDVALGQELQKTLEALRGGWGPEADNAYRDLVIRRASGELTNVEGMAAPTRKPTELDGMAVEEYAFNAAGKSGKSRPRLDAAFEAVEPSDAPQTLYRSVSAGRAERFRTMIGKEYKETGYTSTATTPELAAPYAGPKGVVVRVEVPEGMRLIDVDEVFANWPGVMPVMKAKRLVTGERLMPHGVTFTVAQDGDTIVLRAKPMPGPGAQFTNAEIERGARFFSDYIQTLGPKAIAGETLKAITEMIPVEGASPYDFTQALLARTLRENFRLAESDAIRLAHIQPNRSILERSLNHPFFAMYPSSYFWGKVIPETFKFVAYEPFGMKTTLGTYAFLKARQTVQMQSEYDERMGDLWDTLGKSAVINLFAYLSPSMPWEDMASNLPPWVRALAKDEGFEGMLTRELATVSPERWVSHFTEAGAEAFDFARDTIEDLTAPQEQGLQDIAQPTGQPGPTVPAGPNPFNLPGAETPYATSGPVKGTGLGPILSTEMADLDRLLSGE